MRYRLVPAISRYRSQYVEGTQDEAFAAAKDLSDDKEVCVVVCESPKGGLVRQLGVVGKRAAGGKKLKRAA